MMKCANKIPYTYTIAGSPMTSVVTPSATCRYLWLRIKKA